MYSKTITQKINKKGGKSYILSAFPPIVNYYKKP